MPGECRKKIAVACTERVSLILDAEFKDAANDPVRLIFGVDVRAVNGAGRVDPLENAVAFLFHATAQLACIRRFLCAPTLYSYAQNFFTCLSFESLFSSAAYVQGALKRTI